MWQSSGITNVKNKRVFILLRNPAIQRQGISWQWYKSEIDDVGCSRTCAPLGRQTSYPVSTEYWNFFFQSQRQPFNWIHIKMHFMQLNISTENENRMESWGHTPASDSKLWKKISWRALLCVVEYKFTFLLMNRFHSFIIFFLDKLFLSISSEHLYSKPFGTLVFI